MKTYDIDGTCCISYGTAYWAFVLGYDLMHDELSNSESPECDACFDRCLQLVEEFYESQEYGNYGFSGYEALEMFLDRTTKIHVGDEVELNELSVNVTCCEQAVGTKGIVLWEDGIDSCNIMYDNGVTEEFRWEYLTKTGRRYPINEILSDFRKSNER